MENKKIIIGCGIPYIINIGNIIENLNNSFLYEKNTLSTKEKIEKMRSFRK